ncbi:hypothetical protein SNE40_007042 [Patella caerulea]|uniref:Uncharacterized protein n=1 Tax=Patella caerulea TaxID=87958 RepID=A0AAN8JXQ8_PATCE
MAQNNKRLATYCDKKQTSAVMEGLNEQRKLSRFCDVVLKVCGEQIFAHSNILSSASEYFSSFLGCGQDWPRAFSQKTPQIIEIYIDGSDGDGKGYGEAVRKVVDFMYTSKIDITNEVLNEVIEIAKIMQMNKILEYCEIYLKDETCEDMENSSDNLINKSTVSTMTESKSNGNALEEDNEIGSDNEVNDPDYKAPMNVKEDAFKKKVLKKRGRPRKKQEDSDIHFGSIRIPILEEEPEDENLCILFNQGDCLTTTDKQGDEQDIDKSHIPNDQEKESLLPEAVKSDPTNSKPTRYSRRVRKAKAHPDYVTHQSSLLKIKKVEAIEDEERENKPMVDNEIHAKLRYMCKACNLTFRSMDEYKDHKSTTHTTVLSSRKELSCSRCEFTTKRQNEYKEHMKTHLHSELTCSFCEYQATDQNDFQLHIEKHTGEFPYFCMECDTRFKNKAQQNAHMPKHSVVKPFVCETCNAGFKWKHALKSHMITHSDTKDHLCDICGFATAHKSMLKAHKLIHSGNTYKCDVLNCNFQATKKQNLKYHMLTHSGEKPHQCEVCGQSFSLVKNMKRHMLMHSNDKPIKCDIQDCQFGTTRFDKLKEHKLKQHGAGLPPTKKLRLSDYENITEGHHIIHISENQILTEALAATHNIQEGQIIATVDSGSIIGHVQYAEIDAASGIIQYVTSIE